MRQGGIHRESLSQNKVQETQEYCVYLKFLNCRIGATDSVNAANELCGIAESIFFVTSLPVIGYCRTS